MLLRAYNGDVGTIFTTSKSLLLLLLFAERAHAVKPIATTLTAKPGRVNLSNVYCDAEWMRMSSFQNKLGRAFATKFLACDICISCR